MMNQLPRFLLLALLCLLSSCGGSSSNETSRSDQFLGDYAEYIILDIETARKGEFDNFLFHKQHKSKSTKATVDGMVKKLSKSKSTNAYANVFEKETGGLQCVIVHQIGVSQSVLDHERGHCFKRLFLKVLKKSAPEIYQDYLGDDKYSVYIGESFAEVVATTRSFHIDKDFSYLAARYPEIQGKASFLTAYKASLPLTFQLKNYLTQTNKLPKKSEAQIQFIIENFFIKHVLNRNDFEKQIWWKWVAHQN